MFSHKKVTSVALVAAAALALSGCGLAGEAASKGAKSVLEILQDDPGQALKTAIEKTDDVKSATMAMKGVEDSAQQDMTIKATFGEPATAEIAMVMEGKPVTMATDGRYFLLSAQALLAGVGVPIKPGSPITKKKWIRVDLSNKAEAKDFDLDPAEFSKGLDELNPKNQLQEAAKLPDLKVVGEETIDGVKTVHYTSTATLEKYLAALVPTERATEEAKYKKGNVKDVTTELWVDEKYQLRKAKVLAGTVDNWTALYSGYNTTVVNASPPAAEVMTLAEMKTLIMQSVTAG